MSISNPNPTPCVSISAYMSIHALPHICESGWTRYSSLRTLPTLRNSHFFLISLCLFEYIIFGLSILYLAPHTFCESLAQHLPPWVPSFFWRRCRWTTGCYLCNFLLYPKWIPPTFLRAQKRGLHRLSRALHQWKRNVNLNAGVGEDRRVLRRTQEALGLTSSTPWARNGGTWLKKSQFGKQRQEVKVQERCWRDGSFVQSICSSSEDPGPVPSAEPHSYP